ncbi:MAG TPA: hypothetical protein VE596_16400 [Gaiellaceae bacterium]|jgi:hypothetical protein|nr:hypothetical protein [Gaiellaceae bacterium]
MNGRHAKVVVPIVLASSTLGVLGVVTLVSRAASPEPKLSAEQLSAIASAPRVSAAEAATVREPRRGKPTEPAGDAAITAHATMTIAGEVWKVVSYRSKSGALCAGVTWPGEGQEMGCATDDEWFARGPVSVSIGARQAHGHPVSWQSVVLSGLVDLSHIQKIELVSTDCSKRKIRIDSGGFFLDVTSPDSIARSIWPYQLLGEDGNGRIVQRINVEPEPPDTAEARAAGVHAPVARAACA